MLCGDEGNVLFVFIVGVTLCALNTCRIADGSSLRSNEREKGGIGEGGWHADKKSRVAMDWQLRERVGFQSVAGDWFESSNSGVTRAVRSSSYDHPGMNVESRSQGLGKQGGTRWVIPPHHAPSELEDLKPVVECGNNMMTLSARRGGNAHLFIARENGPPLSILELPSNCGYSVKITWQDLTLKAPYNGCYVVKENDSYVLRLVWWGVPVEMVCPAASAVLHHPVSFSCLPFGVSLKVKGQQAEADKLRLKLNGKWVPSTLAPCVYRLAVSQGEVVLYLPYSVCDLPLKDGAHTLSVLWNENERVISCPAMTSPQFPQHFALNYPFYYKPPPPHPPAPAPTTRSIPFLDSPHFYPTMPVPDPVAKLPDQTIHHTFHPLAHPFDVLSMNIPRLPAKHHYYPVMQMFYPYLLASTTELPLSSPHYHMLPMFYPYSHLPVFQSSASADNIPVPTTIEPFAMPDYIVPTPTGGPSVTLGYKPYIPIACQLQNTHAPDGDSYDPILSIQYPQQILESHPGCAGPSSPSQSLTQLPSRPQTVALAVPPSSPDLPTPFPQIVPTLTCLTNVMTVRLPSAHPDSLKVTGPDNKWVPISTVPSSCAYKLTAGDARGVILTAPLPACHTHNLLSSSSFFLMFWDSVLGQHRILELQCPMQSPLHVPSRPTHPPVQTPVELSPLKPPRLSDPKVFCSTHNMLVELPPGPIESISIKDDDDGSAVWLKDAPKHCGYHISKGKGGINTLILPFSSCHMTVQGNTHRIHLRFRTWDGQEDEAMLSCPVHPLVAKQECSFSIEKRIPCGPKSCSRDECDSLGCCFSSSSKTCYYPMDECTVDHHFVFSVPASITDPPLNPASLFVASNNSCIPQMVTSNFALFKIPLVGCGAHRYASIPLLQFSEIGQTVVYMLEILNTVQSITLGYGTITRDSPLRLLVECRFVPGSQTSVGYLVKTPSLGPSIQAQGTFGVQLRIATGEHYTSYYPQYHRPLRLLLGKPLHLEVRLLNPPDPNLVLLVHYCLAYPRSAQAAWVLIYDGDQNPEFRHEERRSHPTLTRSRSAPPAGANEQRVPGEKIMVRVWRSRATRL
ncbi:hypothetical protein GN956_G8881 [Arapaima gigas]